MAIIRPFDAERPTPWRPDPSASRILDAVIDALAFEIQTAPRGAMAIRTAVRVNLTFERILQLALPDEGKGIDLPRK